MVMTMGGVWFRGSGEGRTGRTWRSREREPIMGVWGQSPQRSPGAQPLVTGSEGDPPKLIDVIWIGHPK